LKDNFFLSVLRNRKVSLWSALQKGFLFFPVKKQQQQQEEEQKEVP
jgi:hypothetical protein